MVRLAQVNDLNGRFLGRLSRVVRPRVPVKIRVNNTGGLG